MKYIFGMEDKEMYLKKNLAKRKWPPNYELNNFIKYRLPLNAKIGSLGGAMSFYADKPIYSYWHDKFNKTKPSCVLDFGVS